MNLRFALLTLVAMLGQGCSVYRPKAAIPDSYTKQVQADITASTLLKDYNALPQGTVDEQTTKVGRRNQIIIELLYLVDHNYYAFENRFYGGQATFNTTTDAVNLGLTAASSVTGTAALKSILSAIATGTTGFSASVEKNYFDQQSRAAVVTKMRSLRAVQLSTIQDASHMKAGVTAYSLESGFADVAAYFDAGTVVGALQSIAEAAGQDKTKADAQQKTNSSAAQAIH